MSASTTTAPASLLPGRLDTLAFALLAVLPLGMALVNRSAQPLLVAAALSALGARFAAGEIGTVRDRVVACLTRPIGLIVLAFLAFGLVSIAWSHHLKVSFSAYGEVLLAAAAALALHAALPSRIPPWVPKAAGIAIAIGCLTMISELATYMSFRASLGVRNYAFIFKRSVTAILIVGWPIAALLWLSGKRSIVIALALLFGIAVREAHSSATVLGLAAGIGLGALAAFSPRIGAWTLAAALAVAMLAAPIMGDAADRLLPPSLVERLESAHARDRINIWQSFGEVVKRRPVGGAGFGTSPVMGQEPVAQEVPAERRLLLAVWHPHNGYLQIWSETGLVGAMLALAALVLTALGIGRMSPIRAATGAAVTASAGAIMLVGHGLWQGWWSAVLGIAAVLVARLPEAGRSRQA